MFPVFATSTPSVTSTLPEAPTAIDSGQFSDSVTMEKISTVATDYSLLKWMNVDIFLSASSVFQDLNQRHDCMMLCCRHSNRNSIFGMVLLSFSLSFSKSEKEG